MFENIIFYQVRLPRQQPRWGGEGWKTESDRGDIFPIFENPNLTKVKSLQYLLIPIFEKPNLTDVRYLQSFLIPIFEKPNLKKSLKKIHLPK